MRVALLHPTYWPEVRRGAERLVHDAAVALAGRGHDVTIVTSHRRRRSVSTEDGVRVVRYRRPPGWLDARGFEFQLANVPLVATELLRRRYDVAHAFSAPDAWAAVKIRRVVVYSAMGVSTPASVAWRRGRARMLRAIADRAARVTALSEAATAAFRDSVPSDPVVLPAGVFTRDFAVEAPRSPEPTLVCAASLDDRRKRGELLLEAFGLLRARRPSARLLLASRPPPGGLPDGVRLIEADETAALARAYASSCASVLPAVDEAFGLVLVESLAAGTPVVAARSGGCPEIVSSDEVGRLFEPDDVADLVRALDGALELAADPATAEACRVRASEYDWDVVARRYEQVYEGAVSRG